MRFITLANGHPDGRLHLLSRDHRTAVPTQNVETMQALISAWEEHHTELSAQYEALNAGQAVGAFHCNPQSAMAPLPRAWQWLDGSAFDSHGELMRRVFNINTDHALGRPLMDQGISDRFQSPQEPAPFCREEDCIDFEGEYGVITDTVALGTPAEQAQDRIRLIVQINDWSLRYLGPIEMKTGFGMLQSKPRCSMAPVAVTPDELGHYWQASRVALDLEVSINDRWFGHPNGADMSVGFDELIAHAAYSRDLPAGTVIGSGTVSNTNYHEVGSSCLSERRAIEMDDDGEACTPFLLYGDLVKMEARLDGKPLFGAIEQRVVPASRI